MTQAQELYDDAKKLYDQKKPENRSEVIKRFIEAAEHDPDLGRIYSLSHYYTGVCFEETKDYKNALLHYKKAYKSSDPCHFTINALGRFYYYGYGVTVDVDKAYAYFTEGAQAKNSRSEYHVGLCHYKGLIAGADLETAFTYFTRSHNANFISASLMLAECYEKGVGTPTDLEAACKVLSKHPKDCRALLKAGQYLIRLGRFDEASRQFATVLTLEQEGSKNAAAAKDWIDKINRIYIPQAVAERLCNSDNDFSAIDAVLTDYQQINAEAVYDLALQQEQKGNTLFAVKLFLVAAANGCKKAQYTICNMSTPDTKYFTEMIEHREQV